MADLFPMNMGGKLIVIGTPKIGGLPIQKILLITTAHDTRP